LFHDAPGGGALASTSSSSPSTCVAWSGPNGSGGRTFSTFSPAPDALIKIRRSRSSLTTVITADDRIDEAHTLLVEHIAVYRERLCGIVDSMA